MKKEHNLINAVLDFLKEVGPAQTINRGYENEVHIISANKIKKLTEIAHKYARARTINAYEIGADYYFYADIANNDFYDNGRVGVLICPIEYFEKRGCISDYHLDLNLSFLSQDMESFFYASNKDASVKEIKDRMLKLGFVENERFSNFCKTTDPFYTPNV